MSATVVIGGQTLRIGKIDFGECPKCGREMLETVHKPASCVETCHCCGYIQAWGKGQKKKRER